MPASYGISAEPGGVLDWRFVDERLREARNYWVVTASPRGTPHAAPVWAVWLDGAIAFGTDADSVKGRNLAASPHVVVHLESGDDAVIVRGTARELLDGGRRVAVGDAYGAKYGVYPMGNPPEPTSDALFYDVMPTTVLAWREHDFPNTATRWTLTPPV